MNAERAVECNEVQHSTDEYEQTVALRDEILRAPLGLAFSPEELAAENESFHLVCLQDGIIVACLVLKPLTDRQIQMRQLAVRENVQGKGIGRTLVRYSESFSKQHGYNEMVMHARETAVEFYEKLDYTIDGDRYIEVTIPHFTMLKDLD